MENGTKEIMVLADGTKITSGQITGGAGEMTLAVLGIEMVDLEAMLTKENLASVQIETEEGAVYGKYYNLKAVSIRKDLESGTLHVQLQQENEIEARLRAVEEGQEIQDGAIMDIATMMGGE